MEEIVKKEFKKPKWFNKVKILNALKIILPLGFLFDSFVWEFILRILKTYLAFVLWFPLLITALTFLGWILGILPDTFHLWDFWKGYFYTGELVDGMNAWRVHILILIIAFFMALKSD